MDVRPREGTATPPFMAGPECQGRRLHCEVECRTMKRPRPLA